MGKLVDGKWETGSVITSDQKGAFNRSARTFLDIVSPEHKTFQPETDRYHLYVGYACPWAHRTLIYRHLKGLESHISVSVVHPDMLEMGWSFNKDFEGATGDHLFGLDYIHQIYQKAQSDVTTSATVPILWDKKTGQIVNNESSEIIRIFNSGFNSITGDTKDFCPSEYQSEIDELNEKIYSSVNNGVYKTGFAKTQEAYDEAVTSLFSTLDALEGRLEGQDFLIGDKLTEADIRLIPTLVRFDIVYNIHFKCSRRRISDFRNLSRYTKNLFAMDAVKKTTNFAHIQRHYYYSHESINPHRIIPQVQYELQD